MAKLEIEEEKRRRIIGDIGRIKDMRRGSVVEQYFEVKRKDGTTVKQGPYFLYTFKEKGKTKSRRLSGPGQAQRYREEIEEFRSFERLSSQLIETSHQICDLKAEAEAEAEERSPKKKLRKRSRKKSSSKSRS